MERLKSAREQKVPPVLLKGFSASVTARIREKEPSLELKIKPRRSWIPVWAPVFAVLTLGSVLVLRLPIGMQGGPSISKTAEFAQAQPGQLSDEIAALSELGVWTDEDERSAGVSAENDTDDLELSKAVSRPDTQLT